MLTFLCLVYLLFYSYEKWTGDFRVSNITYDLQEEAEMDVTVSTEDLNWAKEVLSQSFQWIGHGRQIYAFVSEDGQYVLKILKFKRLRPSWIVKIGSYIPIIREYAVQMEELRLRRIEKLFNGYFIAYNKDKMNTGIRYVHLKRGSELNQTITIKDHLGIEHKLDADQTLFAIQNRAVMTKHYFKDLLDRSDINGVKIALAKLFSLYRLESEQGIIDMDQNVMLNTGFIGCQPIRLDTGQLKEIPGITKEQVLADLTKIVDKRLARWFQKYYPKYSQELIAEMRVLLEAY